MAGNVSAEQAQAEMQRRGLSDKAGKPTMLQGMMDTVKSPAFQGMVSNSPIGAMSVEGQQRAAQMIVDNLPTVLGASAALIPVAMLGAAAGAAPLAAVAGASAIMAGAAGAMGGVARAKIKGRDFDDPKVGGNIVTAAKREAIGEMAGGTFAAGLKMAIGRPGKGLLRILGTKTVADIAESDALLRNHVGKAKARLIAKGWTPKQAALHAKQAFTPAEITNGRIADFVEGASSQSSLFGQPLRNFVDRRNQLIDDVVDNFFDATAKHLDPDDVGDLLASEFATGVEKIKSPSSKMHEAVAERLRSAPTAKSWAPHDLTRPLTKGGYGRYVLETGNEKGLVNLEGIRATSLKQLRENVSELEKMYPDGQVKAVLDQIEALPDRASYDAVKQLRTAWGEIAYGKSLVGKTNTQVGAAKALVGDLTNAMDNALKEFDAEVIKQGKNLPSAFEQARVARQATKEFSQRYEKRWVKKILDIASERGDDTGAAVVSALMKRGGHERVLLVRDAVGATSESWKKFQGATWDYLISKSRGPDPTAVPKGTAMLQMLTGENSSVLGARTAKEIFGPKYGETVKIAKAIAHTQQQVGAPGRILMELTEGGLVVRGLKGQPAMVGREALGLMFYGTGLRKILTTPTMSRLVLQGMGKPGLSREAIAIPARLAAQLTPEELDAASQAYDEKYGPMTRTLPGGQSYTIGKQ